jgi:hypothetical protein
MRYHELDIQSHLKCPMLDQSLDVDGALGCSLRLLRWAVRECFRGRFIAAAGLRRKFVSLWDGQYGDGPIPKDQAYYAALRLGNTSSQRIYLFLQKYEVLKPMVWYTLPLEGDEITGEYALVRKRTKDKIESLPMILVAHDKRPRYEAVGSLEILRYLDLMVHSAYVDAGIYHLPLWIGKPWKQQNFDLPLVRRAASGILGTVRQSGFPIPGAHCAGCAGKACRSIASV